MTKPQTFDEGSARKATPRRAGYACLAGSNGERRQICERQRIGIDAFGSIDFSRWTDRREPCAEAIREAAKDEHGGSGDAVMGNVIDYMAVKAAREG